MRKSQITSSSVPSDLPDIGVGDDGDWEKRATILARENEKSRSRPPSPNGSTTDLAGMSSMTLGGSPGGGKDKGVVSTKHVDDNIQEAIRLHEAGELEKSTRMFGRLADPNGDNNALSQVLYGLALRYVNWPHFMQPLSLE